MALRDKIETLNDSEDVEDHALADFYSKGNMLGSTKEEFEALKKKAYDSDGNIDEEEVNDLLGLTGDEEADLATAKAMGYESAEAYREAFEDALDIEWGLTDAMEGKLPQAIESMSMGASQ
jgi:hypothetical protein